MKLIIHKSKSDKLTFDKRYRAVCGLRVPIAARHWQNVTCKRCLRKEQCEKMRVV